MKPSSAFPHNFRDVSTVSSWSRRTDPGIPPAVRLRLTLGKAVSGSTTSFWLMDSFLVHNPRPIRNLSIPLTLFLLLPICAATQQTPLPAPNPSALVRRGVDNYLAQESAHRPMHFLFHKHDERRDFTQEVIETAQGDVALTIAANGKPLSPADHQLQVARLNNLATHPELQAHRQKREQEDTARVEKMLRLLPDAFAWRNEGLVPCPVSVPPAIPVPGEPRPPTPAEPLPALQCYHLTFQPKPDWNPPDTESRILTGMAGDLWIEESQTRLVRLHAQLTADVSFGWGIVGRLNKGGTIDVEETEFPGGEWELTRMKLDLSGKLLMVKAVTFRMTEEMGHFSPAPVGLDYRKAIQQLEAAWPAQEEN